MHLVHSVVIIIIIMANAKCVLLFKWLINRLNITVSGRGIASPLIYLVGGQASFTILLLMMAIICKREERTN